ncbi:WbqC family protein [Candidatus Peregrinibacteria bacterium]|nr:WbqC family protein [Candidatus Peregrinibacteria bacterium]
MIVTIHQPEYLPYLGFFDRIIESDVFVILDHVQFQKSGFIHRNKIKTHNGWRWLTVTVDSKMKNMPINTVKIKNESGWSSEHYKLLKIYYQKAPFFEQYEQLLQDIYNREWEYIVDLDIYLLERLLAVLGIKTKLYRSSELDLAKESEDWNIDICKKLNGNTYLSGPGGKLYMDMEKYKKADIKTTFRDFIHPEYNQLYMNESGFVPYMSILDLLLNHGEGSLKIIQKSCAK